MRMKFQEKLLLISEAELHMRSQDVEILNSWLKQCRLWRRRTSSRYRSLENRRMKAHCPRWFTAETDGDTGERVWEPVRIDGSSYVAEVQSRTSS